MSALFLAELIAQTSLPKGAFNLVTGGGRVVGDALVTSDKVKMITFTGSPAVGIGIRNKAGLKRVALELGSNAGLIIDRNTNMDEIVAKCVVGAFSNQGQVCISIQRIYVLAEVAESFISKFIAATKQLKVGNPLKADTDIAAMIHIDEQLRAQRWVEELKMI